MGHAMSPERSSSSPTGLPPRARWTRSTTAVGSHSCLGPHRRASPRHLLGFRLLRLTTRGMVDLRRGRAWHVAKLHAAESEASETGAPVVIPRISGVRRGPWSGALRRCGQVGTRARFGKPRGARLVEESRPEARFD
jgi:hypothetical protein